MRDLFVRLDFVKKNLLLLKNLKNEDVLKVASTGELIKCEGFFEKLFYQWRNQRVIDVIRRTFITFCHEIKNPLDREELFRTYSKTLFYAHETIKNLQHTKYAKLNDRLLKIVKEYESTSLLQEKILESIDKAIAKTSQEKEPFLKDALEGLKLGKEPKSPKIGASGVYLMHGARRYITGVFKPFDEEISGPNNPVSKHYRGTFGKRSSHYKSLVGTGVLREVAAYLVDRFVGLRLVPRTCFAEFSHPIFYESTEGLYIKENSKCKKGSLQEYKAGFHHVVEICKQGMEGIPIDELHRLAILDVIIGNQDRNKANLLTNGRNLVAIDHALSFGQATKYFKSEHLMKLAQMSAPFSESLKRKILKIDVEKLTKLLKKRCFLEHRELLQMQERIAMLKQGAKEGQTVHHILKTIFVVTPE